MTIHSINCIVQESDILATEDGVNVPETVKLYCETLKERLVSVYPEADVNVRHAFQGECSTDKIVADTDDDIQSFDDIVQQHYEHGGFFVLDDGTIL